MIRYRNNLFRNYLQTKVYPKYKYNIVYTKEENKYFNINHPYSIPLRYRVNLCHLECYSIDPDNCADVDDAFSIWTENDIDYLGIHISDPTNFFSPLDEIFYKIQMNNFTKYPSNRKALHMMPKKILNLANLYTKHSLEYKPCISIIFKINKETYLPEDYEIVFSTISVKKYNKKSYNVLYEEVDDYKDYDTFNKVITYGIKISDALREKRETLIESLIDYNRTNIKYIDNKPNFVNTSESAMKLKIMIEEYAILVNGIIGNYLYNTNKYAFYRCCVLDDSQKEMIERSERTREELCNEQRNNSDEILKFIITNGVQAYYNKNNGNHHLVNTKHYTHFTSPLRRFTDCITHYILKATLFDLPKPFTNEILDNLSQYSNIENRINKKIQFEDSKIETLWATYNLLEECKKSNKRVYARIRFLCNKSGFVSFLIYNILVKNIDNEIESVYFTHISYSLRIYNYRYIDYWLEHNTVEIELTEVNCITKFDLDVFPDIERKVINPI